MVNFSLFYNVQTSLDSIHLDDGVFKNNRLRMTQPKYDKEKIIIILETLILTVDHSLLKRHT